MPSVTVEVPATTANLGPGFDCAGLALELRNRLRATALDRPAWSVAVEGMGAGELPAGSDNLAVQAMQRLFAEAPDPPAGARLDMLNRVPLCSGLGSSSAAIVGGLVAGNELCGRPLGEARLAALAAELEGHPDNVAAALLGGFVVVVGANDELRCVRFAPPAWLRTVVVTPPLRLPTSEARRALPASYSKADTVFNAGRSALLVAALVAGDREALAAALHDRIHQPYRLPLIPGAAEVMDAARDAGAIGAVLSGAGPTILALCDGDAEAVGASMLGAWRRCGVVAEVRLLAPALDGARVVERTP